MVIENKKTNCIWCGRRLIDRAQPLLHDCVLRSEEHIIPENIFGRVKTNDLCQNCNSKFGSICDHALINDKRIVMAAVKAGVQMTDLHRNFSGTQTTETGSQIQIRYRNGAFKPKPQFRPTSDLMVSKEDWGKSRTKIRESLIAKVRLKGLPITNSEIESEVEKLLQLVDTDSSGLHSNSVIGENFQLTSSGGPLVVSKEMSPWETEWCLAKISFEFASLAWPQEYQIYGRPVINVFKVFLENRDHNPVAETGIGIFHFTELADPPAKQHSVVCVLGPTKIEWRLTFFGTAQWTWSTKLTPVKAPPGNGFIVTVSNPIAGPDATVECRSL